MIFRIKIIIERSSIMIYYNFDLPNYRSIIAEKIFQKIRSTSTSDISKGDVSQQV
jgi:hypothetical protein